jgi:hypothetical protein
MLQVEYVETEADDDGDVAITLSIISGDPAVLARARRAMRAVLDDTPRLASVPLRRPQEEPGDE